MSEIFNIWTLFVSVNPYTLTDRLFIFSNLGISLNEIGNFKSLTINEILTKEEILIIDEILIKEGILTREEIQTRNEIQSKEKILTSKGIYPYDCMD